MKKLKISYILILAFTLTSLGLGVNPLTSATANSGTHKPQNLSVSNGSKQNNALVHKQQSVQSVQSSTTTYDPLVTNVVSNGNFNSVNSSNNLPNNFTYDGTGNSNASVHYSAHPISGLYSGMLEAQGTTFSSQSNQISYANSSDPTAYLNQSLTFSMSWNTSTDFSNSANNNYYAYIEFHFYRLSPYASDYVYYYFSYGNSVSPTNTTTTSNLMLNQSVGLTPNTFSRSISSDFLACFGTITNFYVDYHYVIYMNSPQNAPLSRLVFDNVGLTNSTSYQFISQGTFESSTTNWNVYPPSVAAQMTLSNDSNSNTPSIKMFIPAKSVSAASYEQFIKVFTPYVNYYTDNFANKEFLSFNWNLTIHPDTEQSAYFEVDFKNQTYDSYIFWYLGSNLPNLPINTSTTIGSVYRIQVPQWNSNQTWNTFTININSLFQRLHLTDLYINEMMFETSSSYQATTSLNLLVNNVSLTAFPLGDPGFEENYYNNGNNYVTGWSSSGAGITLASTGVYSGNYALDLPSSGGTTIRVYRTLYMPIERTYFTNFHFKLLSYANSAVSSIVLNFNNTYNIHYLVGGTGSYANTSVDAYYYVQNFNTFNTWNMLYRNLQQDLNQAFGIKSNWVLTGVQLISQSNSASSSINVLFDEMQFFNLTTAPTLNSISTSNPDYYQSTTVTVSAVDNYVGTIDGSLYYDSNGNWVNEPLTHTISTDYSATIPQYPYNTNVKYYVVLADQYGNSATYNKGGADYTFQVLDTIKPNLLFIGLNNTLTNGTVVSGIVSFYINGTDSGSGVNYANVIVGSTTTKITTFPTRFSVDSTKIANGALTVTVDLYDKAGNEATYTLNLTVKNSSTTNTNGLATVTVTATATVTAITTVTSNSTSSVTSSSHKSTPGYTAIATIVGLLACSAVGLAYTKRKRRSG